jgi:phage minor structural protein
MGEVYIYAADADDFDSMGLCGALAPTSCIHVEEENGDSQITMEHPIDDMGKWSFILTDRILKCEIPVRIIPEIGADGALSTTIERTTVLASASKANRYVYSKAYGGKKKKLIPAFQETSATSGLVATEVIVTAKPTGADRYRVNVTLYTYSKRKNKYTAKTYTGFMASAALDTGTEETIADDPAAIETVSSAWSVRPQLFRIYSVELKTSDGYNGVTVLAQRLFYDMMDNVTSWTGDGYKDGVYDADYVGEYNQPKCTDAVAGILDGCAIDTEFEFTTNIADIRAGVEWTNVSPVAALLDPETGVVKRWSADIVRDDWRVCILQDAGMNRGVRIEYAKNMLGVKCTTDMSDIVTAIKPIGQDKKGKPLYLVAGDYTVGTTTVTVGSDLCVKSSHFADYPTPHILVQDLGEEYKATGTSSAALLEVRTRMVAAALEYLADGDPDLPAVTFEVDFVNLGDTAEYAQFAQLENVFLYDRVTVRHRILGIDVLTRVVRLEFDCLTERCNKIELGTERMNLSRAKVDAFQLPSGISGTKIAYETIGSAQYAPLSVGSDTIDDGAVEPENVSVDTYQTTQIDAAAAVDALQITSENVEECETIVNAAGTAGDNLLYNGGINGNLAYGLWCPKERDEVMIGPYGTSGITRITSEMVANAGAAYGVAAKINAEWLAYVEETAIITKSSKYRAIGFRLCQPMLSGHTYIFSITGKYSATGTYTGTPQIYAKFQIGNLSMPNQLTSMGSKYFSTTESTFTSLSITATDEMEAETKVNPILYVELYISGMGGNPCLWYVGNVTSLELHSAMLLEASSVPGTFTDCVLGAYSNSTMKAKLTQADGFVVSGYNEGTQIDGKACIKPTEIKLTNASGTSLVSMTGGAFSSGNGVAAGKALTVTLTTSGWSSLSQSVTVSGLLSNAIVICSPAPSSKAVADAAGVYCSAQAAGSLTFRCNKLPTAAITMNVLALGGVTT